MTSIVLTAQQRKQIERRCQKTLDRRIYQRLIAVLAVAAGHPPPEEIANLLGVALTQQAQWLRVFLNQGLESLCILAEEEPHPTND